MSSNNDEAISVLNDLIETCKDGVNGFRTAADAVSDPRAKTLFNSRAQGIERASAELSAEVRQLGGDPEKTGSVAGAVHRGWINIKSVVTGKDDDAILAECERGEDVAVKSYESALEKNLPAPVRSIVDQQYRGAVANRDAMRALKRNDSGSASGNVRAADSKA